MSSFYNTYVKYCDREQLTYQYEKFHQLTRSHMNLLKDKKVLDFGAGFGEISYLLKDTVNSIDVYDPSKANNDILHEVFDNSDVGVLENQHDCYMKYYDTVLLLCVLEMVSDYRALLNNLIRNMVGKTFLIMNSTISHRNQDFTPNNSRLYSDITSNKLSDVDIYDYNSLQNYGMTLNKKNSLYNVKQVFVIDALNL